jgi:Ras-related protein Rab-21
MSDSPSYKICLLGEGRVGKTSLLRRYIVDDFSEKELTTVQASMYSKKRIPVGDEVVTIAIWDTAGQERFHALGPIYYRDADGALLVYDITDQDTFDRVKHWVRELKSVVGEDIVLCIAGNKCDMERSRQVKQEEASAYCKSVGADHFVTSAKLNRNIGEVFLCLTKGMVKTRAQKLLVKHSVSGSHKKPSTLRILEEPMEDVPTREKRCCT